MTSQRFSWPTTRWPSGCCTRSPRRGCAVPGDVSVVGFDDIPEAGYLNPALTTVRQDFQAIGQQAIDLVTATLDGSTTSVPLLPPELIIRDSTAPYEETP